MYLTIIKKIFSLKLKVYTKNFGFKFLVVKNILEIEKHFYFYKKKSSFVIIFNNV